MDDLAQDGMIEVLRALPSFRGESAFTTWADRIVVRTTLHNQRRARARAAQLRLVEDEAQHEPTVSADGHNYFAKRQLARILDGLPEDQRRALVLHHVVGMSVPEVAEALEVPFDTAKSRIRLGMAKLRKGVEGGSNGPG